jgi:hypothetical protein
VAKNSWPDSLELLQIIYEFSMARVRSYLERIGFPTRRVAGGTKNDKATEETTRSLCKGVLNTLGQGAVLSQKLQNSNCCNC